jgi:alpha-tubulin suppressor-like RCC1 family protein
MRSRPVALLITASLTVFGGAVLLLPPAPAQAATSPGAYAWGANNYGEIGDGTTTDRAAPVPVTGLIAGSGVAVIGAGSRHSLAVAGGRTITWGKNGSGELGDGSTTASSVPVNVTSLGSGSKVVQVAGGAPLTSGSGGHSVALKQDGTVLAWGNNTSGEVGNGTTTNQLTPVVVKGLGAGSGVVAIAAGSDFSLALKSNGTVFAWGHNKSGQLGATTTQTCGTPVAEPCSTTPVQVTHLGAGKVVAIAAGSAEALALKSDGTVLAWGHNASGELGIGSVDTNPHPIPTQVVGLGTGSGATAIACGGPHCLALKSGGVVAWGNNNSGELGDGSTTDSDVPAGVVGLGSGSSVISVAGGASHSLALKANGTVLAWGHNVSGELGIGTADANPHPTPAQVLGFGSGSGVTRISAGNGAHSIALVGASIAVTPRSGLPGASVRVAGSGFLSGETVKVQYQTKLASPTSALVCSSVAHFDGTFSCAGHVPTRSAAGPVGSHDIVANGSTSGVTAKTTFQLT